jgi:hypothetical protein
MKMSCGWILWLRLYKHLVVDVTVTSSRTNSHVPVVGTPLPLLGNTAMGVKQAKLDVDRRTSSSLGTSSIQYAHDYDPICSLRRGSVGSYGCFAC